MNTGLNLVQLYCYCSISKLLVRCNGTTNHKIHVGAQSSAKGVIEARQMKKITKHLDNYGNVKMK